MFSSFFCYNEIGSLAGLVTRLYVRLLLVELASIFTHRKTLGKQAKPRVFPTGYMQAIQFWFKEGIASIA
jgi:hypothetical protein